MPLYFCPFIVPYCPSVTYDFEYKSKKHFDSFFSAAGPKLWNALPLVARSANSLGAFCKLLKSHLVDLAFPPKSCPCVFVHMGMHGFKLNMAATTGDNYSKICTLNIKMCTWLGIYLLDFFISPLGDIPRCL